LSLPSCFTLPADLYDSFLNETPLTSLAPFLIPTGLIPVSIRASINKRSLSLSSTVRDPGEFPFFSLCNRKASRRFPHPIFTIALPANHNSPARISLLLLSYTISEGTFSSLGPTVKQPALSAPEHDLIDQFPPSSAASSFLVFRIKFQRFVLLSHPYLPACLSPSSHAAEVVLALFLFRRSSIATPGFEDFLHGPTSFTPLLGSPHFRSGPSEPSCRVLRYPSYPPFIWTIDPSTPPRFPRTSASQGARPFSPSPPH